MGIEQIVNALAERAIASLLGDTEQPKISANTEKLNLMSDRVREAIYQNANGEISQDELDLNSYPQVIH